MSSPRFALPRLLRVLRALGVGAVAGATLAAAPAGAQAADTIVPLDIVVGRSLPLTGSTPISKVTVARPDVADVVVIGENEVVINGIATGDTDVILWGAESRRHYRVTVRSPQRPQVLLSVKFAEVRKDALSALNASLRVTSENGSTRAGSGNFRRDGAGDETGANANLPLSPRFLTVLSSFNSKTLLGLLDVEAQRGNARFLAEPNLMAAHLEEASFLAGGEIPVPVVQGGGAGAAGGQPPVTIQYREFGIRLGFKGEVLSDSLLKLTVRPEVSSLDFSNGVTIQGFQIPALRTRRMSSTVDVLSDRSLIVSGLFNEEREQVRTGIPLLMDLPILGELFASRRWTSNESELIVVVTPVILDPNNPRSADLVLLTPDTTLPAASALKSRLTKEQPE